MIATISPASTLKETPDNTLSSAPAGVRNDFLTFSTTSWSV